MLRSYSAQLNGAEIIWLDQPPANLVDVRVLVVVDDDLFPVGKVAAVEVPAVELSTRPPAGVTTSAPIPVRYDLADLAGRLEWRGDAVVAQRAQRDAW